MTQPSELIGFLYQQNLQQLRGLLKGLDERHLDLCPYEKGHDLRWVLGHIAVGGDFAGSLLGLSAATPKEWGKLFGPGSTGRSTGGASLGELVDAIEKGHARNLETYRNADSALLNKPHGVDFLKDTPLKTVNDLVGLLMTTHEAYHLAQLSACRATAGLPNLF